MLTGTTRTAPHPEVVFTTLPGGEAVLLHLRAKTYYTLNETGSLIWQQIEKHRSISEIADSLEENFSVTHELAARSVMALANDLLSAELVTIDGA